MPRCPREDEPKQNKRGTSKLLMSKFNSLLCCMLNFREDFLFSPYFGAETQCFGLCLAGSINIVASMFPAHVYSTKNKWVDFVYVRFCVYRRDIFTHYYFKHFACNASKVFKIIDADIFMLLRLATCNIQV